MSLTKTKYEEYVTVDMQRKQFEDLCYQQGFKNGVDYKIKRVDVPDYPYNENEEWKAQKSKADKEYRKLKEVEFKIRNT